MRTNCPTTQVERMRAGCLPQLHQISFRTVATPNCKRAFCPKTQPQRDRITLVSTGHRSVCSHVVTSWIVDFSEFRPRLRPKTKLRRCCNSWVAKTLSAANDFNEHSEKSIGGESLR